MAGWYWALCSKPKSATRHLPQQLHITLVCCAHKAFQRPFAVATRIDVLATLLGGVSGVLRKYLTECSAWLCEHAKTGACSQNVLPHLLINSLQIAGFVLGGCNGL